MYEKVIFMLISCYSIVMAVFWSSIFILTLGFMKRVLLLDVFSISGLVVLYLFCMIRLLIPFEFSWTHEISVSRPYNYLYTLFTQPLLSILNHTISLGDIVIGIWMSVALILLLRILLKYKKLSLLLAEYAEAEDSIPSGIYNEVFGT